MLDRGVRLRSPGDRLPNPGVAPTEELCPRANVTTTCCVYALRPPIIGTGYMATDPTPSTAPPDWLRGAPARRMGCWWLLVG